MKENNWRQPIRYAIAGLIVVVVLWLVVTFSPLISSLVIAGLIAYILHPLVNLITRHSRLSHVVAVNIVYIFFLLLLAAVPAVLVPLGIGQIRYVSFDFQSFSDQVRAFSEQPLVIGNIPISLDILFNDLEVMISQTVTDIAPNLGNALAGISTNFLWILIILVSIYYLLKESHLLVKWGIGFVAPQYRRDAQLLLDEIDAVWGGFLRGQLVLMLIVGILSWVGGASVGLPGAFLVGITAGVLDIIPSLGPVLAATIAVIVALFEGSTYLPVSNVFFAVIIIGIFLLIQQIENIWIRPLLMGRRLKLHPALIFIGVFSSLALLGILVTLLIIPLMATIGIVARYIRCRIQGVEPFPGKKTNRKPPDVLESHEHPSL